MPQGLVAVPEDSTATLTIEDRLRAEHLKQEIRRLEKMQGEIVKTFADYAAASVEEQLAAHMVFTDNRKRLGEVSQELLRLVCI
jgi:hypothetical protein